MFNLADKSIDQALFVIGYKKDSEIRMKQFDIEKALIPLFNVQSVNTNFPDSYDPRAPRVTLLEGNISAHFSQVAAQLTINIDNTSDKPLELIRGSITKKINLFQSCVDKIIPSDHQLERGLVLTLRYPVNLAKFSVDAIHDHLQSRFFRFSPFGDPASIQFSVGYKTKDNFFITLSVMQYNINEGEVPPEQWFDISKLPVTESGVELKIDINSRPLVGTTNQFSDVTNTILQKTFDFMTTEADEFIGVSK